MIKKIVSIKNTGKFRAFSANSKGDIQFNKMNIIYSENGRGKTTLSHIFRSLNEQNEELIIGRKTLGGSGDQTIDVLCDSAMYKFNNNKWQNKLDFDIEIFDALFVSQNVYSKHIIEHDQKKQLYLFTIGKQGVEKANKLDQIDLEIKKENALKKELENTIKVGIQGVLSIDDFISLSNKENIEDEIRKLEQSLLAMGKETEIKSKSSLSRIELPNFDKEKFALNILGSTMNNLLDTAEVLTKQHIDQTLDFNGEKWLEYGVNKIQNDHCPFCKQDIKQNDLINAFKTYFSHEYRKAIQTVDSLEAGFNLKCNIEKLFTLQSTANTNLELLAFWEKYVTNNKGITLNIEKINTVWEEFTSGVKQVIEVKRRSPLENVTISEELTKKILNYHLLLDDISNYNNSIESFNKQIDERKSSISQNTLQHISMSIERLKNIQLRYSQSKIDPINKYNLFLASLRELISTKDQIKADLNTYTESIFKKYQERINWHLEHCGANFKVTDYKSSFLGGKPSSNFGLSINNISVPLGTDNSPQTTATFRNTLSEGDKSSLAFAFFLAKLETDLEIDKKVIIFDDPISSLDNHRKSYTADQVMTFSNRAKQIIVMTHDTYFARTLWGKFAEKKSLLTQLCIKREGALDSTIDSWDIEEETRSDYYQSFFALADFLEGKSNINLRAVAMCIRPLLEGNLRIRFPKDFKSNEWLGNFIDKVRSSTIDPLLKMKYQLSELEEINDYSKKYHHDKNPFADTEAINESELLTFVRRTLKVLQGVHNVTI